MSVTDKGAWMAGEAEVGQRLQDAALKLFRENGFDRTTAAGIAALAGVTERTFFRHFLDKREVLFGGEPVLRSALLAGMAAAPAGLAPMDTLFEAFRSVTPLLQNNRPYAEPRQRVIASTPALMERELMKLAALSDALSGALRARGVADAPADLAARTGMAAFAYVTTRWLDAPDPDLAQRLAEARRELAGLLA